MIASAGRWPHMERFLVRIDTAGHARIDVVDVAGRVVRTLVNESRAAGPMLVDWDLRDGQGRDVASGVYWVRGRLAGEKGVCRLVVCR